MKRSKKALLAAGLVAGAVALTGCTAKPAPQATASPEPQATQEPAAPNPQTAEPSAEAAGEDTPGPIALRVADKEISPGALREEGKLLLPLLETGEALGWKAEESEQQGESQTKKTVTLTKEDSRITVAWTVSDNTVRGITWQKDGLLVPVDAFLTGRGDAVYVPAAFFEEAAGARIEEREDIVTVRPPEAKDTPDMQKGT